MQVAPSWREVIESTLTRDPSLETWSGHFKHRLPELEEILQHWPRKRVQNALEIGCGNGLAAAYFSPLVDKIVATDLAQADSQAHSIGLEQARSFFSQMNLKNAEVLGCSAENIPLPDASFDLVYGIYCLEHIPDRHAALQETKRVLRGGGEALFTVPGAAWALFFPLEFYAELIQRIAIRLKSRFFPSKLRQVVAGAPVKKGLNDKKVSGIVSFFRYYPHFPFPEPHGYHKSWTAELRFYRISHWKQLLLEAGFRDVQIRPLRFLPEVIKIFIPVFLQKKIERALKSTPLMRPFAQTYCIRVYSP